MNDSILINKLEKERNYLNKKIKINWGNSKEYLEMFKIYINLRNKTFFRTIDRYKEGNEDNQLLK